MAFYGKNNSSAMQSFNERLNYKLSALRPEYFDYPWVVDLWYEKPFYGKVDKEHTVVHPGSYNLVTLESTDPVKPKAIDFVADAFTDFVDYTQRAVLLGKANPKSAILPLEASEAYVNPHMEYLDHMSDIYTTFFSTFKNTEHEKKIINFDSFIKLFMSFVNERASNILITKTSFVASKFCPVESSGLAIKIAKQDHSHDFTKQLFINDPNFEFYMRACRNFGFLIDRNAPWRIIANPKSTRMQKYMKNYGVDYENLFETYFYKTHRTDFETFYVHMVDFYNSFIKASPTSKIQKVCSLGEKYAYNRKFMAEKFKTVAKRIKREEFVSDKYNTNYWIDLYFRVRISEAGLEWSETRIKSEIKESIRLKSVLDITATLDYINDSVGKHNPIYLNGEVHDMASK